MLRILCGRNAGLTGKKAVYFDNRYGSKTRRLCQLYDEPAIIFLTAHFFDLVCSNKGLGKSGNYAPQKITCYGLHANSIETIIEAKD